jgi:hypothetical protein
VVSELSANSISNSKEPGPTKHVANEQPAFSGNGDQNVPLLLETLNRALSLPRKRVPLRVGFHSPVAPRFQSAATHHHIQPTLAKLNKKARPSFTTFRSCQQNSKCTFGTSDIRNSGYWRSNLEIESNMKSPQQTPRKPRIVPSHRICHRSIAALLHVCRQAGESCAPCMKILSDIWMYRYSTGTE